MAAAGIYSIKTG
ncbi:hypothetical protein VCHC41A1_0122, partial [Vibrio cholerae HC-41A1]